MERVLYALSMLSVMTSAVSGALAAGRKRFDWVGVCVIATVAAIGGGTLRDVLLGRYPIFWVKDPNSILASLCATALTLVWVRFFTPPRKALLIADALGLALFTIIGAQITAHLGLPSLAVILVGTINGAAGGVLRDLLSGETPLIFQQGELYATTAIAGVIIYLLLKHNGVPDAHAGFLGMGVVATLRFAAILWRIKLPVFQLPEDGQHPRRPVRSNSLEE